jgi:nucleoside-diphosphate-sugar epimerase
VLVIGGSYFLGRIFCTLASRSGEFDLTLVNRGRYPMTHLPGLREFHCDRHDPLGLSQLPGEEYDAVVDLCAYAPGDIASQLDSLPGRAKRYILVSTADVYARSGGAKDEDSPLMAEPGSGAAAEYTWHKRLLEKELAEESALRGLETVLLRPAFIYGPYNYAPRESWYIEKIVKGQPLPVPTDAAGRFQLVYVKDAAEAIMACVRQEAAAQQAFNLAAPEILDYGSFIETLRAVSDRPFTTAEITVEDSFREGVPLPFPLTEEESELFSGEKITRLLGLTYTPFREGMEKTFRAFRSVYE